MGLGYTTLTYAPDNLEQAVSDVAACRYDGIELGVGMVREAGIDTVAALLEEHDLDLYLLMADWLTSREAAQQVGKDAVAAADLGAEYVGLLPPRRGRHDTGTAEELVGAAARAVTEAGVTPLLHHHGGTQVERPAEIERFLQVTEGLELLFDTAHYYPYGTHYPDGDVTDGLERFAGDIEYVHLKDVAPPASFTEHRDGLSGGGYTLDDVINYFRAFTDVGEGRIDFGAVATHLADTGIDHYTIEVETAHADPLVHAKQNRDRWVSIADGRAVRER